MLSTTIPLIEPSLWWLVPYAVLLLVMLYAMMEFTVTLLQRPPANRKPVAGAELRRRLLALNKPDHPHPLAVGQDCDLEMRWQHEVRVSFHQIACKNHAFPRAKLGTAYRNWPRQCCARLLARPAKLRR